MTKQWRKRFVSRTGVLLLCENGASLVGADADRLSCCETLAIDVLMGSRLLGLIPQLFALLLFSTEDGMGSFSLFVIFVKVLFL